MIYDTSFWYWQSVLPIELCDLLIDQGDLLISDDGKTGGDPSHSGYNPQTRETNISFFEPGHWVEGICMHYAMMANRNSGWNVDLSGPQPVQYARYFPDQFYTPHRDDTIKANNPLMRKLSVSIQISDPSSYGGGDFIIENGHQDGEYRNVVEFKPRGSIVVFPSIMKHGVTSVTHGVRHSLVCWVMGPNYR